ncbi:hypothetical protein DXG01_016725 [Tephrocybe rancida]|nr:hypothetical protein DXG01_016725 [Tephrocybe rancida]
MTVLAHFNEDVTDCDIPQSPSYTWQHPTSTSLTSHSKLDSIHSSSDRTRNECMVTLESSDTLQVCRLLCPTLLDEDTLMKLEYYWGCRYGTLDPPIEANALTLSMDFYSSYKSDLWALFPLDIKLLMILMNTDFKVEAPVETAYESMDLFEYVFVPLPGLDRPITRLAPLQEHHFPYTTMPILRLRVQPHYVVFDIARKLRRREETYGPLSSYEAYQAFCKKYRLSDLYTRGGGGYKMWMDQWVPPKFIAKFIPNVYRILGKKEDGPWAFRWCGTSNSAPGDVVGLGPSDSITHIPENEDGEEVDSDEEEDFPTDERDSVFESRMRYWIINLQSGLTPPRPRPVPHDAAHKEEPDSMLLDGGSDGDQGSPTMVGSFVADDSKMDLVEEAPGGRWLKRMRGESVRTKAISDMSLDSSVFAHA